MEWVDAPLLWERMRMAEPERQKALALAGNWLANLHAATIGRPPPISTLHTVRLLSLWSGGPVRGAAARLRARMRRTSVRSGPTAMLHGDFQPGNLFDAGGRLVAFDRQADRHDITFFDVAWFLSHLADERVRQAQKGRPWSGDAETDRQHFFEGYGTLKENDLALYDLVEDFVLFKRWRYLLRRGNHRLDHAVWQRDLLGPAEQSVRPGRLVARTLGGASWTCEPALPRTGPASRSRRHLF